MRIVQKLSIKLSAMLHKNSQFDFFPIPCLMLLSETLKHSQEFCCLGV